ncbi:Methionyl-tRNA formyltransferase (fragment) [Candidatus Promineifilum breve]|uniref:Methionyl-tRNA formyltransferase n=1 Tax=Candidatus Promineifilum breve TaxID=1806508 RepID=A0A160T051_9CHLR
MSVGDAPGGGLRILFFGLPVGISAAVLAGLLADGADVAAVVVPAAAIPHLLPDAPAPLAAIEPHRPTATLLLEGASPTDTLAVAWAARLPVLAVTDFAVPAALAALAALRPDVAVVACFTRRIPAALLAVPRLGFLNLHPSLLPAYRGPRPVYWQLRHQAPTGVTVHYMDEGLDTGDVAAQRPVALPPGLSEAQAERRLMLVGLDLLRGILAELAQGIVRRRPQPPGGSTYGFPPEEG